MPRKRYTPEQIISKLRTYLKANMRILFIVPYVPNLIRVRPYNLINKLSERGHRVTVLTLWTNRRDLIDIEQLNNYCHQVHAVHLPRYQSIWNCLRALPSDVPLQAVYCWEPEATQVLMRLLGQENGRRSYDLIHVEHLRGARYGLWLKQYLFERDLAKPMVWDSVDCISLLFQKASAHSSNVLYRWLTGFERGRTERYERKLLDQFNQILVTSQEDLQALTALQSESSDSSKVSVLENGVDLKFFSPEGLQARDGATLLISGKMSYHANVSMTMYFVKDILPRIWAKRAEVRLLIVGKDPAGEIRSLAKHPNIQVTGTVPDIRPYFNKAAIAVVPLTYGVGIQNKVLEAMAMGTPVISTSQAVRALAVQPGREVVVADGEQEFADVVIDLLDDPAARTRLARNGRHFVEEHHGWGKITRRLEEIYYGILNCQC
jgi:sugar transferase (PEP-CTERM/EpsH1 system associated)